MLNLLPPEIRQRYQVRSKLFMFSSIYLVIIVGLVLGVLGLATYNQTRKGVIGELKAQVATFATERQRSEELVQKAAFIEDRLKSAATYQEKILWDEILTELANSTPTDITITTIHVDTKDNQPKINVSGTTKNRRSIILMRDKITDSPKFAGTILQTITDVTNISGEKSFTFSLETKLEGSTNGS